MSTHELSLEEVAQRVALDTGESLPEAREFVNGGMARERRYWNGCMTLDVAAINQLKRR